MIWGKSKQPGVARQLVTFSCFAKEKVAKKKATPVCRPSGSLDQTQTSGAAQLARSATRPRAQTVLAQPHRSFVSDRGGAQGMKSEKQKTKNVGWARCAHHLLICRVGTKSCPPYTATLTPATREVRMAEQREPLTWTYLIL